MINLPPNPLKKHYKGLPCMLGNVYCRVIGEDDSGSWAVNEDGDKIHSVPLVATPGGSILRSGRAHLCEMTEEDLEALRKHEEIARAIPECVPIYAGKLSEEEIK